MKEEREILVDIWICFCWEGWSGGGLEMVWYSGRRVKDLRPFGAREKCVGLETGFVGLSLAYSFARGESKWNLRKGRF